jgi:hypothetical protein
MDNDSGATTLMGRSETHGEKSSPLGERLALLTALTLVVSGLWFGLPEIGLNPLDGLGLALSCFLLPLITMMLAEALVRIFGRR